MGTRKKVLLAMSGGVDSGVSALVLLEQGYEVIGMHFRLWNPENGMIKENSCCSREAEEFARIQSSKLGIRFYTLNLQDEFLAKVVKPFVEKYLKASTPNPCPVCNQRIKFHFLELQRRIMSADFIATGHYARVDFDHSSSSYQLLKAKDKLKDQSYFLFLLDHSLLPKIIFPLGELSKNEVWAKAKNFGIPYRQRESQDLCFVGARHYSDFILNFSPEGTKYGDIVELDGKKVGTHSGIYKFTIGQRKGLRLPNKGLYVVRLDEARNQVVVGPECMLYHKRMTVQNVNWLVQGSESLRAKAKIRYNCSEKSATIRKLGKDIAEVAFDEPEKAITPGQACVFYDGDKVLGGGWIKEVKLE